MPIASIQIAREQNSTKNKAQLINSTKKEQNSEIIKYNHFITKNNNSYVYNSSTGAFAQTNQRFKEICDTIKTDQHFYADDEVFVEMKRRKIIVDNDTDEL